ncbi:uncharacterized protein EDB91DRAFT_1337509 [Suillus paluster]|uniref:uncharacterized protein n=1 Tax=Suillus paluster TaxID=48578 RepID=UPI001B86DBD0|nr:uncharacterized protein EDB91DRAFT_1337509 [Suillus paluster]KAG1735868.1 hypothetical protein EDB91DRAFT_1337509 [Suillus paluster]
MFSSLLKTLARRLAALLNGCSSCATSLGQPTNERRRAVIRQTSFDYQTTPRLHPPHEILGPETTFIDSSDEESSYIRQVPWRRNDIFSLRATTTSMRLHSMAEPLLTANPLKNQTALIIIANRAVIVDTQVPIQARMGYLISANADEIVPYDGVASVHNSHLFSLGAIAIYIHDIATTTQSAAFGEDTPRKRKTYSFIIQSPNVHKMLVTDSPVPLYDV